MVKFGQGVYWGDGSWWAQIMGVVGGKRVAGVGGLGEWVSGGRLTAGGGKLRAGHARPLRGGGRVSGCGVVSGHLCRGGGVLDVPRRGQDPSLQCERSEGGYGKARGPGMPGPYGRVEGERVLVGGIIGPLTAVRASISGYGARGGRSGPGSYRGRGRSRSGCGPRKSADG